MRARALGISFAVALILLGSTAQLAHADEGTGGSEQASASVVLPAETASVWVELELAGLSPNSVTVRSQGAGGDYATIPMLVTTFGLHGQVAAEAGDFRVQVTPNTGAAAALPDLVITALDGEESVLEAHSLRISIPAGPQPHSDDPPTPATPTDDLENLRKGGSEGTWWLIPAAVVLIAGGVGAWLLTRRSKSRGGDAS